MIPTLTNNDSITSHNLRRHTDPPWLWAVVCIGSVSLHLLVFWLMRSSNEFTAWFPPSNQSSIPIDFIEIPSEPKSTIKPQSTTSKIKPEPSFLPLPNSSSVTPNNQDDGEITSRINLPEQDKTQKSEVRKPEVRKPEVRKSEVRKSEVRKSEVRKPEVRKSEVEKSEVEKSEVEKPEPEKPPVRQQFYPTNPTPEATPIIPESERPWNRRQEVKLGEGTLLPQDIPTDSPTPTAEPSANPNPEPSPSPNVGGAIATVSPILKEEVSELIQQKQLIADALPDVLAEYKGSTEKELEASILPSDEVIKPANILASLIIDKNGQFQQAIVITIEPAVLRSQTNIYEQALNEIFAQESFLAAYNQDGSKPDLSNLYIRLKIKPINSQ
ncbi:hypothetical protein MEN41_17870 [Dolichospermum sp. ST_con]|nr:hypothetical protein [Dolichospermum sp. ST_con]MDD1421969.1 hypothetical protein [Dolichospermum sp. ST_sed1]MDD1427646.1 hypothetical protein [Dolichospermum sp. ST_sed9]MDD1429944.1 hypothetical protein [Dolichospermum sp. ST_sed6]MDD1443528.1 hypothetical protein [Dolichospermum sp. ST_sed3]MDD1445945.1 hypothetical protein [Dolichospermum sp. ST_sed8]MDD1453723.1 hypothetical protein [Dolichospermum sp. ST_sed7]MDD1463161.1 hypothetical protein [Dolichospermum sp. ST_sed2]MDD1466175